jgi:hypothetical protein
LRARGKLQHRLFAMALPLVVIFVGLVFVLHSQHGGGDVPLQLVQHRILGSAVILAGLVKGVDALLWARGNWARVGWLLLLLAASLQLFLYVEGAVPPGGHGGH